MTRASDSVRWRDDETSVIGELTARLGHRALTPVRELSGASGARTYLCSPEGTHGRPNAMIVKIGTDDALASELAGLKLARAYFRDSARSFDSTLSVSGMTAVPLEIAGDDALTFEDFYTGSPSPDPVLKVIDDLFVDVLRLPELTLQHTNKNAFELYSVTNEDMLGSALREVGDEVPGFLEWWNHAGSALGTGSYVRLCHGDLHGRNILVSSDDRTYVIDFGHTGERHALRDLAKLEREIHLTLLGSSHAGRWISSLSAPDDPEAADDADPELVKAAMTVTRIRHYAMTYLAPDADGDLEYGVALTAQFMFAAGNRDLPMATRRAALRAAQGLRAELGRLRPSLRLPSTEVRRIHRLESLWRFAYTFARLDQQPGGGWARTLYGWMSAIWEGDDHQIHRNPAMRRQGGTDLTCYTIDGFVTMMQSQLPSNEAARVFTNNEVLSRAFNQLKQRIGFQGGAGTAFAGPAHADVKIRHTAMTIIATLRYRQGHDGAVGAVDALQISLSYLAHYLQYWRKDTAYTFGMAMACVKLSELLRNEVSAHLDQSLVDRVQTELEKAIPEMLTVCEDQSENVIYLPHAEPEELPKPPFFRPYCDFWRMERSGFLMYVGMAFQENGEEVLQPVGTYLRRRFVQCFDEILGDVGEWNPGVPETSLVRFHRGPGALRDWGLSAELAALLAKPGVRALIEAGDQGRSRNLERRREALQEALLATFDQWRSKPSLFAFMQGASALRAIHAFPSPTITSADIGALDFSIDSLRNMHMTQWHLHRHVQQHVLGPSSGGSSDIDTDGLRDLLVEKLEAGEYIEADAVWAKIADVADKLECVTTTGGAPMPNEADPAVAHLRAVLDVSSKSPRHILDVSDEDGSYGSHLRAWGMGVSSLNLARREVADDYSVVQAWRDIPDDEYDAITVRAAIMHVPRHRTLNLYEEFLRVLRPEGWLLLSLWTKDHCLINVNGRFVQYYVDEYGPQFFLRRAGFEVTQVINDLHPAEPMSGGGRSYAWAHLFCRKPSN